MASPDLGPLTNGFNPTYGEILGTIGAGGTVITLVIVGLSYLWMKAKAEAGFENSAKKTQEVALDLAKAKAESDFGLATLQRSLNDHKISVAEQYVSIKMLERFESRIFAAISEVTAAVNRMSARLDGKFDRDSDHRN